MSGHLDLEAELRIELEKLDQIFQDSIENNSSDNSDNSDNISNNHSNQQQQQSTPNSSTAYSPYSNSNSNNNNDNNEDLASARYELAEAEIEKEDLQDKLRILSNQLQNYDQQILDLSKQNLELRRMNDELRKDNNDLLGRLGMEDTQKVKELSQSENSLLEAGKPSYETLEQMVKTLNLAKDILLKEIEREKALRQTVEKQRNAYSAAYEKSSEKIGEWLKSRESRVYSRKDK